MTITLNPLSKVKTNRVIENMKIPNYRISFVLGLIGSISIFLNAIFAFLAVNAFLSEFGQVPEIRTYTIQGVAFLVVGLLSVIGCIKGKKFGSYSMVFAGVSMLIILGLNGWFPALFMLAGAYSASKERSIPQNTSL